MTNTTYNPKISTDNMFINSNNMQMHDKVVSKHIIYQFYKRVIVQNKINTKIVDVEQT